MRFLTYDYLNRKVVWGELSAFTSFILPIISRSGLFSVIKKVAMFTTYMGPISVNLEKETRDAIRCGACGQEPPTIPRQILPCRHVYCLYCIDSLQKQKCVL